MLTDGTLDVRGMYLGKNTIWIGTITLFLVADVHIYLRSKEEQLTIKAAVGRLYLSLEEMD